MLKGKDLESLLQPEGMECGVAMIRAAIMQGLKKREKSLGVLLDNLYFCKQFKMHS
jgi:hypothetical protein